MTTNSTLDYLDTSSHVTADTIRGTGIKDDDPPRVQTYAWTLDGALNGMTDTAGSNHRYDFTTNPHGDISLLLGTDIANHDSAVGTPVAAYANDPYGNPNPTLSVGDKPPADAPAERDRPINPYRFNANRYDPASNTIDMGARRYAPDTTHFLQPDAYQNALADLDLASDPLTQNRYAYAGGNPINFVEYGGHDFFWKQAVSAVESGFSATASATTNFAEGSASALRSIASTSLQNARTFAPLAFFETGRCDNQCIDAFKTYGASLSYAANHPGAAAESIIAPCLDPLRAGAKTKAAGCVATIAATSVVGSKGSGFLRGAAENGVADVAYHYTFSRAVGSIETYGLRPGSYATIHGDLSPLQAHIDLALPPNRGLPYAVIRIDLAGLRKAGYKIPKLSRVGRSFNMPGGGYELRFPYAVPPDYISVVRR